MMKYNKWISLCLVIGLAILLAGCGGAAEQQTPAASGEEKVQYEWKGRTISISKEPKRISALSSDVTEALLNLVDTDRVAVVSSNINNENMSHFSHIADKFDVKVSGFGLDPEQIIAYDTDLVLITMTHEAEQDAIELLSQSGIPLVDFDNWNTVESLIENIRFIGQITNTAEEAAAIIKEMEQVVSDVQEQLKDEKERPVVMALSQVSSNSGPYLLGPTSITYDVLKLAGAKPASDVLNLERTAPVSIEHIMEIDPDYILLVEWSQTSEEFAEMVQSEAFQMLKASKAGQVKYMKAKDVQISNPQVVLKGLREISAWLHPQLFEEK